MIGCRKGRWYSSKCGATCAMGTSSPVTTPPRLARCYRPCVACRLRDKAHRSRSRKAGSRFRVGMEMAQREGRQTASTPPRPEVFFLRDRWEQALA